MTNSIKSPVHNPHSICSNKAQLLKILEEMFSKYDMRVQIIPTTQ